MQAVPKPRLSVSTWSLHRALGRPSFYGPEAGQTIPVETHSGGAISLLQLPAHIAAFGIRTLEICHFHLPSRDHAYLRELRGALDDAGVELFSLLVDAGDLTHPEHAQRDLTWIGAWLDVAGHLGARCMRVIAGKAAPSAEALEQNRKGLALLVQQAETRGVRLMTENWFGLLSRPETVNALLDSLDGALGLCVDFGNWSGPTKYDDLAAILPRAESCHAKCSFPSAYDMDREDFVRCLELSRAAGFAGPYTLIYDGPGDDEWRGLDLEREIVRGYV